MAELKPIASQPAEQAQSAWWRWNVRLVSVGLCIWFLLTMLGAMFAGQAAVSTMQFVLAAQWIPLSYLVLVLAYCVIVNRRMAQLAEQVGKRAHSAEGDVGVNHPR
jgi:uncharacterized membrane protein